MLLRRLASPYVARAGAAYGCMTLCTLYQGRSRGCTSCLVLAVLRDRSRCHGYVTLSTVLCIHCQCQFASVLDMTHSSSLSKGALNGPIVGF